MTRSPRENIIEQILILVEYGKKKNMCCGTWRKNPSKFLATEHSTQQRIVIESNDPSVWSDAIQNKWLVGSLNIEIQTEIQDDAAQRHHSQIRFVQQHASFHCVANINCFLISRIRWFSSWMMQFDSIVNQHSTVPHQIGRPINLPWKMSNLNSIQSDFEFEENNAIYPSWFLYWWRWSVREVNCLCVCERMKDSIICIWNNSSLK